MSRRWIRVAGVGKRARSVRFAMVRSMASLGIVLRGRRRESCALAKIAGFRGPVREFACAGACSRVTCCEIVAGAGNLWICGCKLGADTLWNAAAGCVGRVACVALCHGDCCWACRGCGAVPVGVSRGWRRVLGIADQGLVAALVRVGAGVLASQNGSFWYGSGRLRGPKKVHF